jgi:hypothetical protein
MADNTANVALMIDYLVGRYGKDDAAARAKCLAWLQEEERDVWGMMDWWFKQAEQDIALEAGTKVYTVGEIQRVVALLDGNGFPLDFFRVDVFSRLFRNTVVSGTPVVWTLLPLESGTQLHQLEVWPVPDDALNWQVVVELAGAVLSDSAGSVSRLPEGFRGVLLAGAELRMAKAEGQVEQFEALGQAYKQELESLAGEDGRQKVKWV